ncbi:hypothetical protein [Sanguibacter antarcticus]|uniref:hypothetical protein n=1 Tax=Sanguibacter antarcticus TaxID=372484 RepID=UPI0014732EAF|nr:hypothetical protein [Sanguibacter antarcticus]
MSRFTGADQGAPTQAFAAAGSVSPKDADQTAVFPNGTFGGPAQGAPQAPGFGGPGGPAGPGGWQPPPSGGAPGSKPKAWLIPVIIGVVALLAIFGVLFATGVIGGGDDDTKKDDSTSEATEKSDAPTDEESDEPAEEPTEKESDEPTDEPTDEATGAASDNGTRAAPLAPNETAMIFNWSVSMAASNLDAWAEISPGLSSYSLENYAPPAGSVYVMAPATVTYTGPDREDLYDLDWVYVGANGTTYDDNCNYVELPNELDTGQELYTDGTATGNICVTVPEDQAADGVWRVSAWGDFEDDYEGYFAIQ